MHRNIFIYIHTRCRTYNLLRTMCSTSVALIRTCQLQDFVAKKYHFFNLIVNFRGFCMIESYIHLEKNHKMSLWIASIHIRISFLLLKKDHSTLHIMVIFQCLKQQLMLINDNYFICGAFLRPGHYSSINRKLGSQTLPTYHRLKLCKILLSSSKHSNLMILDKFQASMPQKVDDIKCHQRLNKLVNDYYQNKYRMYIISIFIVWVKVWN